MIIGVLGVLLTLQPITAKSVTGTLMCGDKPYPNAKVQLEGTDSMLLWHHISQLTMSDASGKFSVTFDRVPANSMYLSVTHKCNYHGECVLSRAHYFDLKEASAKDSLSVTLDLADDSLGAESCD
ncbi:unnamed protein product [Nippostrongylus brasiliensis]|uniref:Carboxypeptidase regulatory-like domain-containing protein n=1 Tax=Nippostrongylus brasiliensis TaxID=27835 RepID=A0A0N4XIY5_NIPBR|nr:unnamed protein product [Nippostrongylus brasiliensis]